MGGFCRACKKNNLKTFRDYLTLGKAVNKFNRTNEDVFVKMVFCDRIRKIKQEKQIVVDLKTHRLQRMVSHLSRLRDNNILSANEQIDFIMLVFLFFCSFTDKILNSYTSD